MRIHKYLFLGYLLLIVFLMNACTDSGDPNPNESDPNTNKALASVTLSPTSATININQTLDILATGHYSDQSTRNLTSSLEWSSDNESVAVVGNQVSNKGIVTAISAGVANIKGEEPNTGNFATARIVVTGLPNSRTLVLIRIDPLDSTAVLGASPRFTAVGTYSDSTSAYITNDVDWVSTEESVAVIDNAADKGLVTTVGAGETQITATDPVTQVTSTTSFSVTAKVMISIAMSPTPSYPMIDPRVLQSGSTQQLRALAVYSDQSREDITDRVTWQSSNENILQVSNSTGAKGEVTAINPGIARVSATDPVSNIPGSAGMTIYPVPTLTPGDIIVSERRINRLIMVDAETNIQMTVPRAIDNFRGLSVDSSGLLYTVDTVLNGIIEIDAQTKTQTLVAEGWYIDDPWGVVKDFDGNYYVIDHAHNGIIKIDASNHRQHLLSTNDLFEELTDIAIEDNGNGALLVIDATISAVVRVDKTSGQQTILSQGDQLYRPTAIAVASNGDIFATDENTQQLIKIDPVDGRQTVVGGGLDDHPTDLFIGDNGVFYIATEGFVSGVNQAGGRLLAMSPAGNLSVIKAVDNVDSRYYGIARLADGKIYFGVPDAAIFGRIARILRIDLASPTQIEGVVGGRGSIFANKILQEDENNLIFLSRGSGMGQLSRVNLNTGNQTALCCDTSNSADAHYLAAIAKDNDGSIVFTQRDPEIGVFRFIPTSSSVNPISIGGLLTGDIQTNFDDVAIDPLNGDIYVAVQQPVSHALVKITPNSGPDTSAQLGFPLNCTDGLCNVFNVLVESDGNLLVKNSLSANNTTQEVVRVTPNGAVNHLFNSSLNNHDMVLASPTYLLMVSSYKLSSGYSSLVSQFDLNQPTITSSTVASFADTNAQSLLIAP